MVRSGLPDVPRRALLLVAALLGGLAAAVSSATAPRTVAAQPSPVPVPTVTGPITGGVHGVPFGATPVPITASGYIEQEYFVAGSARATGASNAPYTTRIVVRRPTSVSRFNGTLVVEWYNVTDQSDNDFDWHRFFPEIMQDGFAFAAVSAQFNGFPAMQAWDPVRYATLSHPGDTYAFDIFAQAVQAMRTPASVDPLAGLAPKRVLATGDSQSADELSTYISQGLSRANHNVDGFLIDSGYSPTVVPDVPVLENATEGDIVLFGAKKVNSGVNYRLWNTAGASHVDTWELGQGRSLQTGMVTWDPVKSGQYGERGVPTPNNCSTVGDMFPGRYAWDASLYQLDRWVLTGIAPPPSPLITVDASGAVVRDAYGNATGGLRLPPIDLPVATYVGGICVLYGTTTPLSSSVLAQLYPSHQYYVDWMAERTAALLATGFMLPIDATDLMTRACASDIGGPAASATCPSLGLASAAGSTPPAAATTPTAAAPAAGASALPNTSAAQSAWWPWLLTPAMGAAVLRRRRARRAPPTPGRARRSGPEPQRAVGDA